MHPEIDDGGLEDAVHFLPKNKLASSSIYTLMKSIVFILLSLSLLTGCKKKRPPALSSVKVITSFTISKANNPLLLRDIEARIEGDTIYIGVNSGLDMSALIPGISFNGKTLSPASGQIQNFTSPVTYTVTAEDGSIHPYRTKLKYLSSEKQITSFTFKKALNPSLANDLTGIISGDTIAISFPPGTAVTGLVPTILHTGIAISPVSGQAADFTYSLPYTVQAEDGSARTYTVFTGVNTDVLVQGSDGFLYAINGITGGLKWRFYTGAEGVPTSHEGVAFATGLYGTIYAVNMANGSLKWKSTAPRGNILSLSIPSVKYGKVYYAGIGFLNYPNSNFAYYAEYVHALNEQTGSQEWLSTINTSYSYVEAGNTSVTVEDNMVCLYDYMHGLFLFHAGDGSPNWNKGDMLGRMNPAIANGVIYYGIEGGIRSLNETGQQNWMVHNDLVYTTPSILNDVLYTTTQGNIYAIRCNNGSILWQTAPIANSTDLYAPVICNNSLIIVNKGNELMAFSIGNGSRIWLKKDYQAYPVAANGEIFISDVSNRINCLDAANGNIKWMFTGTTLFKKAACVVDSKNMVYHTPESGESN